MLCTHPALLTRRLNPTPTVHCPPSLLCVRSTGAHFFRRSRKFSFIKRKSFRNRIQIALSQNRFANTQSHQYTSLFSSDASPYKKIEMEQTIVLLDFVFAPTSLQRRDSFLFLVLFQTCVISLSNHLWLLRGGPQLVNTRLLVLFLNRTQVKPTHCV